MPVSVVNRLRPVHRNSHKEIILFEKSAPLFIKAETVCLERIHHAHPVPVKPLFIFERLPEEVNPSQSGFAALKRKTDLALRLEHGFFNQIL